MKKIFLCFSLLLTFVSFSQTKFEIKEYRKVDSYSIKGVEVQQSFYVKVGIKGSELPLFSDNTVIVKFSEDWTFKQSKVIILEQLNSWLVSNYPEIPCK